MSRRLFILLSAVSMSGSALVSGQTEQQTPIPEDLLADEHVAEEFGVNSFTAPSIEKIFRDLEKLGDLPYTKLSRKLPHDPPKQRSLAAISLGGLIADALLTVQAQQRGDLQPIGRALMAHAEILGTDKRMSRHSKRLVELSLEGKWGDLKKELVGTQQDVEAELVLLRDPNMAHLISLGGWLRACQMASLAIEETYSAEKLPVLMRIDVADYFLSEFRTLRFDDMAQPTMDALKQDLVQLRQLLLAPKGGYTKEQVGKVRAKVTEMLDRLMKPTEKKPVEKKS